MPQMKPLKWLLIMLLTLFSIFMIMTIIYSMPNYFYSNQLNSMKLYTYKIKW